MQKYKMFNFTASLESYSDLAPTYIAEYDRWIRKSDKRLFVANTNKKRWESITYLNTKGDTKHKMEVIPFRNSDMISKINR